MTRAFIVLCLCWLVTAPVIAAADIDAVTVEDRLLLADALYGRGMYEQARREYAVLAADTKLAGRENVLFRLAESCRRLNRKEEAETSYGRLVAEFPQGTYYTQAQLQRATLAVDGKRFKDAVSLLEPLAANADLPPDVAPALLQVLAEALDGSGQNAAAIKRYNELRRRFPDSEFAAPATIKEGYALMQSGKAVEAIAVFREAEKLAKGERVAAEALFQLGQALVALNKPAEAVKAFADLRQKYPGDPRTRAAAPAAAWACHDTKDYDAAIAWIPSDNGTAAERANFLYLRADSERRRGRLAEAAAAYKAFIEQCPGAPQFNRASYEYLLTLFEAKRYDELLKVGQNVKPEPAWAADYLWMCAEANATLQRNDAAIALYTEIGQKHQASPFAADALVRAGWLLQAKKEWKSEAQSFALAAERYPAHKLAAQSLYAAGVCYSRTGDSAAALASWSTLSAKHPDFAEADEALFQSGLELLRAKKDAPAIETFSRLLAKYPQTKRMAEAYYWRGVLRRQTGDAAGAVADFKAVLNIASAGEIVVESRLALGSMLLQQGEAEEAASVLQPLLNDAARDLLPPDRLAWLAEFQYGRNAFAEAAVAARTLVGRELDAAWSQTGWALLGRAQFAQKLTAEAIASYTRAVTAKAETKYLPESLLRLGELLTDDGKFAAAESHLREAVAKTAAPEWQEVRAHAYAALGRCAEARGQNEEALRYYLSVALLYDDAQLVPMTLDKAANLHLALGRTAEGEAVGRELVTRYPDSPQAKAWQARLADKEAAAGREP